MTNVNWILYDGDPSGGGSVIASGSGLSASAWSNIYRTTETTIGVTNRPIMADTVPMGGLFLPAGTYWLAWQTDGVIGFRPVGAADHDQRSGNHGQRLAVHRWHSSLCAGA